MFLLRWRGAAVLTLILWLLMTLSACSQGIEGKPLPELLELHKDEAAKVDREALKQALRTKLESVPIDELFRIRQDVAIQLIAVDFLYPSLQDRIKKGALFVEGTVRNVAYGRGSVIEDILERDSGAVGMTITVEVARQYPDEPDVGSELTYTTHASWEYVHFVQAGVAYLLAFTVDESGELRGGWITDTYPVSAGKVQRVVGYTALPLDEAWDLIETQFAIAENNGEASEVQIAQWRDELAAANLVTSVGLLKLFSQFAPDSLTGSEAAEVVERHYESLRVRTGNQPHETMSAFRELVWLACDIVERTNDLDGIAALYSLYVQDNSQHFDPLLESRDFDHRIVGLVGSEPHPERIERLTRLFREAGRIEHRHGSGSYSLVYNPREAVKALTGAPGEEINTLLLDMNERPGYYRMDNDLTKAFIWSTLAARGVTAIRPHLEMIATLPAPAGSRERTYAADALAELSTHLPEEEALALLRDLYRAGHEQLLSRFLQRAPSDSAMARAFLLEIDLSKAFGFLPSKFADPVFVPQLVQIAEREPSDRVMVALHECGAPNQAANVAERLLQRGPGVGEDAWIVRLMSTWRAAMLYLARYAPEKAPPLLKPFTEERNLRRYRAHSDRQWREMPERERNDVVDGLRWTALMGLAVAQGAEAVPAVRKNYQQADDKFTFAGAWILYALGDDADADVVRAYQERTLESKLIPYVAFHYIRSPRTDAVLVKRLKGEISHQDLSVFRDPVFAYRPSSFARDHLEIIVPILLKHVQSEDDRLYLSAVSDLEAVLEVPLDVQAELRGTEPELVRKRLEQYAREILR